MPEVITSQAPTLAPAALLYGEELPVARSSIGEREIELLCRKLLAEIDWRGSFADLIRAARRNPRFRRRLFGALALALDHELAEIPNWDHFGSRCKKARGTLVEVLDQLEAGRLPEGDQVRLDFLARALETAHFKESVEITAPITSPETHASAPASLEAAASAWWRFAHFNAESYSAAVALGKSLAGPSSLSRLLALAQLRCLLDLGERASANIAARALQKEIGPGPALFDLFELALQPPAEFRAGSLIVLPQQSGKFQELVVHRIHRDLRTACSPGKKVSQESFRPPSNYLACGILPCQNCQPATFDTDSLLGPSRGPSLGNVVSNYQVEAEIHVYRSLARLVGGEDCIKELAQATRQLARNQICKSLAAQASSEDVCSLFSKRLEGRDRREVNGPVERAIARVALRYAGQERWRGQSPDPRWEDVIEARTELLTELENTL